MPLHHSSNGGGIKNDYDGKVRPANLALFVYVLTHYVEAFKLLQSFPTVDYVAKR